MQYDNFDMHQMPKEDSMSINIAQMDSLDLWGQVGLSYPLSAQYITLGFMSWLVRKVSRLQKNDYQRIGEN